MEKGSVGESRRYESEKLQQSIRQLLKENKSRKEIAEIVGVHERTVDRYIHNIHEEDKIRWSEIATESLTDRAIRIKEYYEKIADKAEQIIDSPDITAKDLDIAGKLLIACHRNVYDMIKFGPLKFPNSITVEAKPIEDKSENVE